LEDPGLQAAFHKDVETVEYAAAWRMKNELFLVKDRDRTCSRKKSYTMRHGGEEKSTREIVRELLPK
jgi:hypothetical protein